MHGAMVGAAGEGARRGTPHRLRAQVHGGDALSSWRCSRRTRCAPSRTISARRAPRLGARQHRRHHRAAAAPAAPAAVGGGGAGRARLVLERLGVQPGRSAWRYCAPTVSRIRPTASRRTGSSRTAASGWCFRRITSSPTRSPTMRACCANSSPTCSGSTPPRSSRCRACCCGAGLQLTFRACTRLPRSSARTPGGWRRSRSARPPSPTTTARPSASRSPRASQPGVYRFLPGYSRVELVPFAQEGASTLYEIVGTSLWNLAMPLVRYRTGDLVSLPAAWGAAELRKSRSALRPFARRARAQRRVPAHARGRAHHRHQPLPARGGERAPHPGDPGTGRRGAPAGARRRRATPRTTRSACSPTCAPSCRPR